MPRARSGSRSFEADLAILNAYRLDHDLTWKVLAEHMSECGFAVSWRGLYQLVRQRPVRPIDRTVHKIHRYVELLRTSDRLGPKRRARSSAAASANSHTTATV